MPWDRLSGEYTLCPGENPSLRGHRPVLQAGLLGQLLRGKTPQQVNSMLGSLFTLCAHAHCRTSSLLFGAVSPSKRYDIPHQTDVFHLLETARDHLRSIALDWPQRLPDLVSGATALDWLQTCPLRLSASLRPVMDETAAWEALAQLRDWLTHRVLLQPVADWLDTYRDPVALVQWCQTHAARLLPARCLSHWHDRSQVWVPELGLLDVLDTNIAQQSQHLVQLAEMLSVQPNFAQHPTWLGQCTENGPWTRLHLRQQHTCVTVWRRLSSRWLELIELANASAPNTSSARVPLLASGALLLANGQALAWCEMARGLLFHWARWDDQGILQDYKVLAPTEWNFHPKGALAQAVAALSPGDTQAAQTLAAAFDPCVACSV
jgi:hypothetical protein